MEPPSPPPPAATSDDDENDVSGGLSGASQFVLASRRRRLRRYYGLVKRCPQDFEVREVDVQGRVADITRPPSAIHHLRPAAPAHACQPSAQQQQQPSSFSLEDLVSPDDLVALEALHGRAVAALEGAGGSNAEADAAAQAERVVLAAPADNADRGALHREIKSRFPTLRTGQEPAPAPSGTSAEAQAQSPVVLVVTCDLAVHRKLLACVPDVAQVLALHAFIARGRDDLGARGGLALAAVEDKGRRRELHQLIAQAFPMLRSHTRADSSSTSVVCVDWAPPRGGGGGGGFRGGGGRKRKRGGGDGAATTTADDDDAEASSSSPPPPPLLRLVLRKENVEHLAALSRLARALRVPASALGHAGVKDKRAVTYQYLTLRLPPASDPAALLAAVHVPGLQLGEVESGWPRPLRLSESRGNAFRLVVRGVRPLDEASSLSSSSKQQLMQIQEEQEAQGEQQAKEKEELEARLTALREGGFINYFGWQRLGPPVPHAASPVEVGRALLREDWEDFLRLVFGPREGDSEALREAKALFWAQGRINDGDEGRQAATIPAVLKKLPRSMLRERLLLQGLHRHGRAAVAQAAGCIPHHSRLQWLHSYQAYLWNRAASARVKAHGWRPALGDLVLLSDSEAGDSGATGGDGSGGGGGGRPAVRVLAPGDDLAEQGLMERVVLPLVGPDVVLPGNAAGEAYRRLLEADGLWAALGPAAGSSGSGSSAEDGGEAKAKRTQSEVFGRIKGAYRPLMARPRELQWAIRHSGDDDGLELDLQFQLGPGSFATMLLWELLRNEPTTFSPAAESEADDAAAAVAAGDEEEEQGDDPEEES